MPIHRTTSRILILFSALMAAALAVVGTPAYAATLAKPDPLARFYAQTITWQPCGDQLECGTVLVPLDYRKPKGPTISIAVNRRLTAGPGAPSLLFNPGGPGGSGTEFVADADAAARFLSPSTPPVQASYNLVGFDPRGVGTSMPLECVTQAQLDSSVGSLPRTPIEQAAQAASDKVFGEICFTVARGLVSNMGTEMVARDLDIIRSALGARKLDYYGISYGTYIGQVYAHLFPGRVGHMVLDSVLSPSANQIDLARVQATGFQEAFNHWAQTCPARQTCPAPPGMPAEQIATWATGVMTALAGSPLPIGTAQPFTQLDAMSFAAMTLSAGGALGPTLLDYMVTGITRPVPEVLVIVQNLLATQTTPNEVSASPAVMCFDRPTEGTLEDSVRLVDELSAVSPVFGAAMGWGPQVCFTWPVRRGQPIASVAPVTRAPVLIIGGLHDPNTPYAWSVAAAQLFPASALLTWDGWGHSTGTRANACVNNAASTYLVTGVLPPPGVTCPDDEVLPE